MAEFRGPTCPRSSAIPANSWIKLTKDTAWQSPCKSTRVEFWLIFGTMLSSLLLAMIIPFMKKSEKRKQDLNRNQDATREELERLLEEEESRKLGDGKGNGRFLFDLDRFLNEIVIFALKINHFEQCLGFWQSLYLTFI